MLVQAMKRRLSKEENQKGFTLIELLAVIVILGIIAVIAIPMISGIINNTGDKADLATARQAYEAARMYVTTELDGNPGTRDIPIIGTAAVAASGSTAASPATGLMHMNFLENPLVLPSTKENIIGGIVKYTSGDLDPTTAVTLITANKNLTFTKEQILKTKLK
ncbi:type II secretion system protein [Paenibacillus sp. P46E]|uniref:type II secretion system protein n=1 Tax=Paenibacillus sp. P46E TaxID=1349436 RepID=UPI00096205D3|nr:prepilin-type N-terminal cleavage/methylation domain-containing protein [Paenibacillus sp. P46E]OKP98420.1 hypothetical protein A3849_09665 [Paenibacillus sp. P46E]